MKKNFKPVKGSRLQDGHTHAQHHACSCMGRRDFLFNLGLLSAGSVALAGLPLNRLMGAPLLSSLFASSGDRVLVLIRLKGGNDGLNT
ncbi:MAG TPA: hypothetical protein VNJ07_00945, partial [Chitinophagales bacterium]|nr:hypothetical protein [Chitinophagales bacterium]